MATTQGYIKLHRKIFDWEHYGDMSTTAVFLHLLLSASTKDFRAWGETIHRGQVFVNYEKLAATFNVSVSTIQRCLKKLKESGDIKGERRQRGALITIVNYNKYQQDEPKTPSAPPPIPLSGFEQ